MSGSTTTASKKSIRDKQDTPRDPLPPMRPHRKLLIVFSIIFALWVAAMIVMYYTTVYPHRHPYPTQSDPAESASK